MSDVSYKQAVEIIKSGIDSSENISEKDRGNIAESLLEIENPQSSGQLEGISLRFTQEQKNRLEAYLSQLEEVRQSDIDQEVGEAIQRARRLGDLRNELKTRIHSAMDEAKELEQIANKLQDDNLGNIAGKEEHEIKHLGEKLQQIDSKAEEVEQLEQKISSLLGRLGEKSLKEHLEIKESAVTQILQESSGNNGSTGNNETQIDIDQLAQQIIRDREKLEKFEQKVGNGLQRDIEKLSKLTEHKKNEISGLAGVHSDLQEGNLTEAKDKLNKIEDDRENILGGESIEDVFDDIQEIKKISVAVRKFFEEIKEIDQQGNIHELETALASNNDISEHEAERLVNLRNQKKKYEKLKEVVTNVEELEKENLGLDQEEYQRVKKLFNHESHLADRINDPGYQQMFNSIHSELEQLGHEIEHDIQIEGGSTSSDSETGRKDSDTGSYARKGPDPNKDPWIVCLSDIETAPEYFKYSLKLVNEKFQRDIVNLDDGDLIWAGNNYHLIINGDLIQMDEDGKHRHGGPDKAQKLIEHFDSLVSSAEKKSENGEHPVQFTVGNHDVNLIFGEAVGSYPNKWELKKIGSNFVDSYQNWINQDIVKMIIEGYNWNYVHAGQAHEWDDKERNRANQLLKQVNKGDIDVDSIPYFNKKSNPPDYGLAETKFSELPDDKLNYEIMKLFSVGDTSISRTGDNKHAGMIWARPNITRDGPPQIVGHTGKTKPVRDGNLIIENTIKKDIPSVVVETPSKILRIWKGLDYHGLEEGYSRKSTQMDDFSSS